MFLLFLFLSGIIAAYLVVTDGERVREIAETSLSQILGAKVTVEKADLSLFEGLRLDGVKVYVDEKNLPDSCIFSASRFFVRATPRALLAGRLEAVQIVAIDPHVLLCENVDVGKWNYERFAKRERRRPAANVSERPMVFPEILLRGGLIEYSRMEAGKWERVGEMAIDGQLSSLHQDRYAFDVHGRTPGEGAEPHARGVLDADRGSVDALLDDVRFDRGMRAMLPAVVQEWWERHQLAGRIRIPVLHYKLAKKKDDRDEFYVEVEVDHVRLAILPEEMLSKKDYDRLKLWRPGFAVGRLANIGVAGRSESVERIVGPQPIGLDNVTGKFVFTPDEIRFANISGKIEGNGVTLSGVVGGYTGEPSAEVRIVANNTVLPLMPKYLASLPRDVQKLYSEFRPVGKGNIAVELVKREAKGRLETSLELNVTDGAFSFHELPYPLRHSTGTIRYYRDRTTGWERVDLVGLKGYGVEGTENANKFAEVSGSISPLDRNSMVRLLVKSDDCYIDPFVRPALPPEAREALGLFDTPVGAPGNGTDHALPPRMRGKFEARVFRPFGIKRKVTVDLDLTIDEAEGAFAPFPYPVKGGKGFVEIRSDHVEVKSFVGHNAGATLALSGRVDFGKDRPVEPNLRISVRNAPIDDNLKLAMPEEQRAWMAKAGIGGVMDADGRIFLGEADAKSGKREIDWDLGMKIRQGTLWPVQDTFAVTDAVADVRLTRSSLEVRSLEGKRGEAKVSGTSKVAWPSEGVTVGMDFVASGVAMDPTFYALIPEKARKDWDELRPVGTIDLRVKYQNGTGGAADFYDVRILPRQLSVFPVSLPWKMEKLAGEVAVGPGGTVLKEIVGSHGNATVRISGKESEENGRTMWRLAVAGERMAVNDELKKAIPEGLASFFKSIKLRGEIGFNCPEFVYRTVDVSPSAQGPDKVGKTAVTQMEFGRTRVDVKEGSMDVGVPLTKVNGGAELSLVIRDGDLYSLSGKIDAPSLMMVGRALSGVKCDIVKPAGMELYQFASLRGKLGGGELAGQVDLATPKDGSSRYALALVLRGCDVKEVMAEKDGKVRGRVTGSLALEGNWSDGSKRRGRGDIQVQGNDLYKVPVMFGLLQMANLSFPIKSPFNEGAVQYTVDGNKIVLERMELRAENMVMQGSGLIDFSTRRVAMTLTTDNPNWPKIPLIGELLQGAKHELFNIQVRGTVEDLKVGGRPMNTLQTTVEEVLSGKGSGTNPQQQQQGKKK